MDRRTSTPDNPERCAAVLSTSAERGAEQGNARRAASSTNCPSCQTAAIAGGTSCRCTMSLASSSAMETSNQVTTGGSPSSRHARPAIRAANSRPDCDRVEPSLVRAQRGSILRIVEARENARGAPRPAHRTRGRSGWTAAAAAHCSSAR